jgi:hypothetical protein
VTKDQRLAVSIVRAEGLRIVGMFAGGRHMHMRVETPEGRAGTLVLPLGSGNNRDVRRLRRGAAGGGKR